MTTNLLAAILLSFSTACAIPGLTSGLSLSAPTTAGAAPAAPIVPAAQTSSSAPVATTREVSAELTRFLRRVPLLRASVDSARGDIAKQGDVDVKPGLGATIGEMATRCRALVARDLADGVPPDAPVAAADGRPLRTIVTEICDSLDASARTLDSELAATHIAYVTKMLAPFKAAGLTGDKLAMAVKWHHNDDDVFAVGGAIATPATMRSARALFLLSGGGDREWTLIRYQFVGDKLVATTSEGFLTRPGPSKFR